jgi:hypothetical protein
MSSLYALSHESLNDGLNWEDFIGIEDVIDISDCVAVFIGVWTEFNDIVCAELCCLCDQMLPVLCAVWWSLDNLNTTVNCLRKLMCDNTGLLRWIVCDNQYIHTWRKVGILGFDGCWVQIFSIG